ncbi:MAG TPA: mannose-1-phosphate guanylyltransferase, partial [Methylophaga sp.]|nr:mannose-1-phosphate guanylyltransferase [Methylophaga sp.]
ESRPRSMREALEHVMVNNPAHNPAGDFYLESEGLLSLEGEPKLTFSGIGIYRPEMFAEHPVAKRALKPFFVEVMKQKKATGQHYQGQWSDIGTVERLTLLAKQLDI